ncbi:DUF2207 domain-containing protein [Chitinophaga arvensicola]|uniref:Uncharacterized protein n=1 Tax=Chitinophaga arvensicola TaxID=29529 RepID=A0A1I0QWM8_9BACT|nr:hypothetical protein [Chitinophaga arvensicola]SEW31928.1 hypothetical protein SAMN04488122_1817 [Chitinophaga arvensicola]
MKNENTPARWPYLLLFIPFFFLPLWYVHEVSGQWNPFAINGKQFLWFYGYAIMLGYAPVLLWRDSRLFPSMKRVVAYLLIIGVCRLCQGWYHGKPVGFLVLMLIGLLVLWLFTWSWYMKKR